MSGILPNARGIEVPVLKASAWCLGCIPWCILLPLLSDLRTASRMRVCKLPSPYMEGVGQRGTRCGFSWMSAVSGDKQPSLLLLRWGRVRIVWAVGFICLERLGFSLLAIPSLLHSSPLPFVCLFVVLGPRGVSVFPASFPVMF